LQISLWRCLRDKPQTLVLGLPVYQGQLHSDGFFQFHDAVSHTLNLSR
jgi:hypothetical protein